MGGGASCAVQIKRDTTEISGSLFFFFFFPRPQNGIAHKEKMSDKMTQIEGNQREIFFSVNKNKVVDNLDTKRWKSGFSSIGRRRHIMDEFVYPNHLNFFLYLKKKKKKLNYYYPVIQTNQLSGFCPRHVCLCYYCYFPG